MTSTGAGRSSAPSVEPGQTRRRDTTALVSTPLADARGLDQRSPSATSVEPGQTRRRDTTALVSTPLADARGLDQRFRSATSVEPGHEVAGAETNARRLALVCLGNICRSPMAEVVLRDRLAAAGLERSGNPDGIELVSAGTGGWHVGEAMDRRAAATLREAGYDPDHHRARQWPVGDPASYALVLAMDHDNLRALGGPTDQVRLFRDFDPIGTGGDVPDPYYGGDDGFREVLEMVERTSDVIVERLTAQLQEGAPR